MTHRLRLLFALLAVVVATSPLGGCCGFDCDDDDDKAPGLLNLGLSDALPEDLKAVVLEIDQIVLRRSRGDEVQVNTFTFGDLVDEESFKIDLLEYQGVNTLAVINGLELATGTWNEVFLRIIDGDSNSSYVQEAEGDEIKELNVDGEGLTLPNVTIAIDEETTSTYVIEFGLPRALQYVESGDTYLMSTEGLRLAKPAEDARLLGDVDSSLFNTASPCDEKIEPTSGNRIYVYEGKNLPTDSLGDVYTSASSNDIPQDTVAPFAVGTLSFDNFNGTWRYSFGYLPAGDYTLAFSCDADDDNAVDFDQIVIPLPDDQVYELTLTKGTETRCNLTTEPSC